MLQLLSILRTVFETEAETLILPLAFDLTEKAETRILLLVIENCPDYCCYYCTKKLALVYKRVEQFFK
jgi:L-lysine 2,3-aminomutase